MKLTVNKALLGEAANLLAKVINPKNALPILGDVLFDVKNNEATLTASDSEVTLTTTIKLDKMEGDGRFCVSATELTAALAQLSDQPLTITATTESDNVFTIEHSSGRFFFPIESADEYPLPMAEQMGEALTLDAKLLADALKRSAWAQANDDLRPVMGGTCLNLADGWLDIVTSDGHALVKTQMVGADTDTERKAAMIVPKKAGKMMQDILTYGDVQLEMNERTARLTAQGYVLTFRLIEGKYPNYNSVIPKDAPLEAVVPRAFLANSLRKVMPFAGMGSGTGSRLIRMKFEPGLLTLTGEDYDFQKGATDKITIEYQGSELEIGVNGSTLITILSKLPGMETLIRMTDASRAITLEPNEADDDVDILMLAMSMLLNE